jgi:hypothetical protein
MIYKIFNGPMQTTAAPSKVAVSTLKTLMQLVPKSGVMFRIIEWGFSGDASVAATPGIIELIETDVAATVTAYVANDITKSDGDALNNGDPTTALINVGTSASGYTATAEGTITAVRNLDTPQLIAPTNQFFKQIPLDQEAVIQAGKFARIRASFDSSVNVFCYMVIEI